VHGWLLVGGSRLSKTRIKEQADDPDSPIKLTQISPEALTSDFGVDAVRYHLLRNTPLGTDGDFSYEGIVSRYNSDLANNLGNLVARVATVVGSKCGGIGPAPDPDSRLKDVAREIVEEASQAWERFAPHEGLEATWRLIRETNADLETAEPWKQEPGPATDAVLGNALEVLRIVSILIVPAMPSTAREIWRRIGLAGAPGDCRLPADGEWGGYPGGLTVVKGDPLFPRRKV
jgi:methionyl-tRNA synthetase